MFDVLWSYVMDMGKYLLNNSHVKGG